MSIKSFYPFLLLLLYPQKQSWSIKYHLPYWQRFGVRVWFWTTGAKCFLRMTHRICQIYSLKTWGWGNPVLFTLLHSALSWWGPRRTTWFKSYSLSSERRKEHNTSLSFSKPIADFILLPRKKERKKQREDIISMILMWLLSQWNTCQDWTRSTKVKM